MRFQAMIAAVCAALCGCAVEPRDGDWWSDGESPPPPDPACIEPSERRGEIVTVSGSVIDHAGGEAVAAADVAVNTAWDVDKEFPVGCPPIATLTTTASGRFGPETIQAGSRISPPIALFLVTGPGLADTASDETLRCGGADCEDVDHVIAAPDAELAAAWREELERGGMQGAATRGLVLFEFQEADGSPAEGVTPAALSSEELALEPGAQVRFLEEDRVTLAPVDTPVTTASGLALIGANADVFGDYVFGERGEERWELTGVLDPPGWIFVETLRVASEPAE